MTVRQLILGIESSCDESAAAVFETGKGIRSSTIFSQIDLHKVYGGVVPEIASRSHIEKIHFIVKEALNKANVHLNEITGIAVTTRPGLPGSLLIGLMFAKGLAFALKKPLVGVNHIEGHIFSALIEQPVPFPHLCLTASGGHTSLYHVTGYGEYECISTTLDDAAGEAFDKVAKLIGLGYPGGPLIENLAEKVAFKDFFSYPRLKHKTLDFSFSGLKTAVLYDLIERGFYDKKTKQFVACDNKEIQEQIASSFLVCVGDIFTERLKKAYLAHPAIKAITFVGGVACNNYLAQRIKNFGKAHKLPVVIPPRHYCGDNAAMIAFVGDYRAQKGLLSDLSLDITQK